MSTDATRANAEDLPGEEARYDLNELQSDLFFLVNILGVADNLVAELRRIGDPEHDTALDKAASLVWFANKHARYIDAQLEANFATIGSDTK